MILLDVTCHAPAHDTPEARRLGCVCPGDRPVPPRASTRPRSGVRRCHALSDRQRRAAVAEYVEGDTLQDLAVRYDCSRGQIRAIVRAAGVEPRPRGESRRVFNWHEAERIAKEYAANATLLEIAARYGCSYGTARRAVLDGGGQLRPAGTRRPRGGVQC